MKKNMISNEDLDERLGQLFKQAALGADLEDLIAELVPADNPWWTGENMPAAADRAPSTNAASSKFPWLNRISSILDRRSDWKSLATRIFEIGAGAIGNGRQAFAGTASKRTGSRAPEASNFRTWQQGGLRLTLSCGEKAPYLVTLNVDESPDAKVVRLCWIHEDTLAGDPEAPLRVVPFSVKRIDEGTYSVDMKVGVFSKRMHAIAAAERYAGKGDPDPRLLLPFVEME